ncbi:MAG: oligoendopeptidase F [Lactobacillus sp.]|jgi:oligoendopeptidase F|nr:oligoendopeptidase F [Lactobacillus sp.]MCI1482047.1 oligoendopeptidase F [Lactobacillus sp.]
MTVLKREQVPTNLTWDLTKIYPDQAALQADLTKLNQQINDLASFSKTATDNSQQFFKTIGLFLDAQRRLEKLYAFASLASDTDTGNQANLARVSQMQQLETRLAASAAFLEPAIISLSDQQLDHFIKQEPELKLYRHWLSAIRSKKEHTLSPAAEKLIAGASDALQASTNTFNVLANSDLQLPFVEDENGDMVQLTEGLYDNLIQSKQADLRDGAFTALLGTYEQYENSFASTLSGTVKAHNYLAQVHQYPDARTAALATNHIPVKVYDTLVETVHKNLPLLHNYVSLRKRLLQLTQVKMSDMYVPLIDLPAITLSYQEAQGEALKALSVLGPDYQKQLKHLYQGRIIDVVESKGKVTGAYSGGSYDTEPYILLNWENNFDSLFTLVHESGHSVHSLYTNQTQPYVYGNYPIFLAEIASTTNENLLIEYLLKTTNNRQLKAFLLNYFLDSFKGTIFRQTQFAEFEEKIHLADQRGTALTADYLDNVYDRLNQTYYGPEIELGSLIKDEWARIPHFYYNFYVYQYATGFAAASALAQGIINQKPHALKQYLGFLKAGSSNYPLSIMQEAGVDMTQADYLQAAFDLFKERLEELKQLLN